MGNVGNIEKVMVFGILAIILCILGIALWGHNEGDAPPGAQALGPDGGMLDDGDETGTRPPPMKVTRPNLGGDDDPENAPAHLLAPPEVDAPTPPNVTQEPVVREPEPASPGLPRTHTVRKGDTYSSLAEEYLGDANLYVEFQKVNEDVDPRQLREGMVVNVPRLDPAELSRSSRPSREPEAPREPSSTAGGVTYVVRSGDTLSSISRQFYGTPNDWGRIADANPRAIPNPDRLKVGVEIVIP